MTVLFQSIRSHQVLSEPWRRSIYTIDLSVKIICIYTSSRNNSMKELFHHPDLSEFYLCGFLPTDKIHWTLVLEIKLLLRCWLWLWTNWLVHCFMQ